MIEVEKIQISQVSLLFNKVEDSRVKACLQSYIITQGVTEML